MTLAADADRYLLDAYLDEGHFGKVYRARHAVLGHTVALKLVHTTDAATTVAEAQKAASLPAHPNVIKVLDAGVWSDGRVFIASAYSEAGSLDSDQPIDPVRACTLVSGACRGLSHMHQHGLLHLDLRPANILLGAGDTPILTDFGLAQWAHEADIVEWYFPHAAPEYVEMGRAEPASDIWAMGMTLAHLLTGGSICRPFPTNVELLEACVNGEWPRLREIGRHVPPKVCKVIAKATRYDPTDRYGDVEAFKHALDRATPKVALAPDGDLLRSTDGDWTVTKHLNGDGTFTVTTKRRNRRRSDWSVDRATLKVADKQVAAVVKYLAG